MGCVVLDDLGLDLDGRERNRSHDRIGGSMSMSISMSMSMKDWRLIPLSSETTVSERQALEANCVKGTCGAGRSVYLLRFCGRLDTPLIR